MDFTYEVFGLIVRSELELPELTPAPRASNVDVTISFDTVPASLPGALAYENSVWISPKRALIKTTDFSSYLIENGNRITIDRAETSQVNIRLLVLGNVFTTLLYQRELLVLHASAVALDQGCVLFIGHSGAGKSTTMSVLMEKGYSLFSDDICPVQISESGSVMALPGFSQVKLKTDLRESLNLDEKTIAQSSLHNGKEILTLKTKVAQRSLEIKRIYVLNLGGNEIIELEELGEVARFAALQEHTHRGILPYAMGMREDNFRRYAKMARFLSMKSLSRPKNGLGRVEEIGRLLEEDFISLD